MARILVIDDDPLIRSAIRLTLEKIGHEVIEAANGRDGIVMYQNMPADLVITDIVMPDKEGIETILALRGISADLKIIAISGRGRIGEMDYLQTAKEFGANFTFEKPIEWPEMLVAIQHCLGLAA